jgi:hypothetical protein
VVDSICFVVYNREEVIEMEESKWQPIGAARYSRESQAIIEAAAKADPAFAKKLGIKVGAVSDYVVEGFAVEPATNVKAGDDLFLDVYGDVYDVNAGLPDKWQIAVAGTVVDNYGNPTNLAAAKILTSGSMGYPEFYSNHIKIRDFFAGPYHSHLVLGKMPNNLISWAVELFACHDDVTPWAWSLWDRTPFLY